MNKANIIVMGKTGVGKSTLVNAVLGEKRAKTGVGHAQTLKNETYNTNIQLGVFKNVNLNLMDTVGLELDSRINTRTIEHIRERIDKLSQKYMDDKADIKEINMVWYCVNPNNNRFEDFEEDFIKEMMYDYEIPFMIVLTQCYDEDIAEAMKEVIHMSFPKMPIETVLAEAKKWKYFTCEAYGVKKLLDKTVKKYNKYKLNVLQDKLEQVDSELEKKQREKTYLINRGVEKSRKIIADKAEAAFRIGCIPGASLVALQSQYTAMVQEIVSAFGIALSRDAREQILAVWVATAVFTPILAIPFVAGLLAKELILESGEEFLDSVVTVVRNSSRSELENSKLVSERLKNEIKRRKK